MCRASRTSNRVDVFRYCKASTMSLLDACPRPRQARPARCDVDLPDSASISAVADIVLPNRRRVNAIYIIKFGFYERPTPFIADLNRKVATDGARYSEATFCPTIATSWRALRHTPSHSPTANGVLSGGRVSLHNLVLNSRDSMAPSIATHPTCIE